MRLLQYLSFSGVDEKTNIFRALKVRLTDMEKLDNRKIVEEVVEEHSLDDEIIKSINDLNKELKKEYRGKYRFDFCLEDGYLVDQVRIKNKDIIKRKLFEINSSFGRLQTHLEKKISEEKDK